MTNSHRGEPHYHTRQHTRLSFHLTGVCLMAVLVLACTACGTTREYAYISDAERDSAQQILNSYNSTIMPGDELHIYVDSQTPESVLPFNTETNRVASNLGKRVAAKLQKKEESDLDGYIVDDEGRIAFPIFGHIQAAGITRDSLAKQIQQLIIDSSYVNDPIVTVELMNFRVTVLGEVAHPKQLHVVGDRLTIFEALAMVGDITKDGKRENVSIVRSENGQQTVGTINLSSKEIFDSPYYYLKQNDIVYVEPSDLKKKLATRNERVPQYITLGVSSIVLVRTIWRIITSIQKHGL